MTVTVTVQELIVALPCSQPQGAAQVLGHYLPWAEKTSGPGFQSGSPLQFTVMSLASLSFIYHRQIRSAFLWNMKS